MSNEDNEVRIAVLETQLLNLDKKFDKLSFTVQRHMDKEEEDRAELDKKLNKLMLVGAVAVTLLLGDGALKLLGIM